MKEDIALFVTQAIMCSISIVGSLIVISIYMSAKSLRTFPFKLVFWLNLNNLLRSLAIIVPGVLQNSPSIICQIDAYIMYSSSLGGILWTFVIAYKMNQSMLQNSSDLESDFSFYTLNIFLIPFSVCLVPFAFDLYGSNELNCLLINSQLGEIFRFTLYYFPASIVTVYCCIVYRRTVKKIKEDNSESNNQILRLVYFPLILIICIGPMCLLRIFESFGLFNFYVYLIFSGIWCLNGFFDTLAYALTPPVIQHLKSVWNNQMGEELIEVEKI